MLPHSTDGQTEVESTKGPSHDLGSNLCIHLLVGLLKTAMTY